MSPGFLLLWDGKLFRNQKPQFTKDLPHQNQSNGMGSPRRCLTQCCTKLPMYPKGLPHQTRSHHKRLHQTLLKIYGKLCSRRLRSGYLELSSYKTAIEGSGVFVSVAVGEWGRGGESEGAQALLDLKSLAVHKQWNHWNDTANETEEI